MIHHTITNQAHILRVLSEHGMDGKIKPLNPSKPGAVGMFPDSATDMGEGAKGTYYLVDKHVTYTMFVLEDATLEEAVGIWQQYALANSGAEPNARFERFPTHAPNQN